MTDKDIDFFDAMAAIGLPVIVLTGPECDGEDCDEYEHRAGCALWECDHSSSRRSWAMFGYCVKCKAERD